MLIAVTSAGDRLSRLFVLVSAVAALALIVWLGAPGWPGLRWAVPGAMIAAAIMARRAEALAFAVPLGVSLVVPVLYLRGLGVYANEYAAVWTAAIIGAAGGAPGGLRGWALPARWRPPLVLWAMLLSAVWPIVVAREANFQWAWLTRTYHMANSGIGGPPPIVGMWIATSALAILAGLLWCDRLFVYADTPDRFRRCVVVPFGLASMAGALVGVYQGTVDVNALNDHQWPELGRAGGGLTDADAFGAASGLWVGAFAALAMSGGWAAAVSGVAGAVLALGGVWASGSRMAMLAALISVAGVGLALLRATSRRQRRVGLVVAAVLVVIGLGAVTRVEWTTDSPVRRVLASLPEPTPAGMARFVRDELFDRGAPYGTATVWMFAESPLAGAGLGTFHQMFPDYAYRIVGARFSFDNAQSWFRQQVAENGVLGSVGWIWWVALVAAMLWRTRGGVETRASAIVVKGALVALAAITAVSLPTQDSYVALMPWFLVFWYVQLSPEARASLDRPARWGGGVPVAFWAWTVLFVVATAWVGVHWFRPPLRAIRAAWPYTAGFYDEERPAGEPAFQWTEGRAVQVVRTAGPWMKLTVDGGPTDLSARPSRLVIRRNDAVIIDVERRSTTPRTWYVAVPPAGGWVMFDVKVDRTWHPGGGDPRALGVRIEAWSFVSTPPDGATVIR